MSKFKVEVVESRVRAVEVEAESEDEALIKVERAWYGQEIVLDAEDFLGVEFHMLPAAIHAKQTLD